MQGPFDLITIGNVCCDIFVPEHARPPPGGITTIASLEPVPGGNGANTAITAARLGLRTAIAGTLGDDLFGRYLRSTMQGAGVDTTLLELKGGRSSPVTLVHNDPRTGERSFVHHPGTNADFTLGSAALAAPCRVFHFAAPELLAGLWPVGAVQAARSLRSRGVSLSLDTFAVEDPGDASGAARIAASHEELLSLVDMVFPNEAEARLITGESRIRDMTERFHSLGVGVAVVKRGEKGAVVSWNGRFEEVPVERVNAIDTCGAGDNFSAGFLAGHLRGLDPLDATRLGCALGSLCVAFKGATTGTEDPKRLRDALQQFDRIGR